MYDQTIESGMRTHPEVLKNLKTSKLKPKDCYIECTDEDKNWHPRDINQVHKSRYRAKIENSVQKDIEKSDTSIPAEYLKVIIWHNS